MPWGVGGVGTGVGVEAAEEATVRGVGVVGWREGVGVGERLRLATKEGLAINGVEIETILGEVVRQRAGLGPETILRTVCMVERGLIDGEFTTDYSAARSD